MISLDEMTALARALQDADRRVAEHEALLNLAKEHARELREETIPAAMQELGLANLTLDTGEKLSVKPDVYASINEINKADCFRWLEANGFAGLIKTEVTTAYGKGEREKALELIAELQERGLTVGFDENVHNQTLKAFIREQLAKGTDIPLDLFNARPIWVAKIK